MGQNQPGGHTPLQSAVINPALEPYRPPGQATGVDVPTGQYDPTGQSKLQLAFNATVADHLPAAHCRHVLAAALLYWPAEQLVHAPNAPRLKVPAGQTAAVALTEPAGQ